MAMIESRDQTRLLRAQHAVAEHVAAHVADADRSEWLNLNIRAQFTKVALHALPGAARGDAHFLVVVAGAATGRKCITKPETIFVGNPIRQEEHTSELQSLMRTPLTV